MKLNNWFSAMALTLCAMTAASLPAQENKIYAQKLVDQTIAKHPELRQIGLHSIPPNSSDSMIIAINDPKKVGKKSDPDDLEVMKTGKPSVEIIYRKQIYELGFPLLDRSGNIIGVAVMEIKLSAEKSKESALQRGKIIQEELRKEIPSKEKLFEPVS
jgi:iron complex outermembrane receptor protein